MSQPTPKPRSSELDAVRVRAADLLPTARLSLVLAAALDRAKLERIVARSKNRPEGPFAKLGRDDLASFAAIAYAAGDDVVYDVVRELDRATENERTIVGSMDPAEVTARFVTKAALRIKRHGALLVWAVVRDERLPTTIVQSVIDAYVAGAEAAAGAPEASDAAPLGIDASIVEQERVHLMVEIGRREAALKAEAARASALEAQVAKLEAEARTPQAVADTSSSTVRRLEKRIAHLEREVAAADELRAKVVEIENDNEQLQKTIVSLRATLANAPKPRSEPPGETNRGLPMTSTTSAAVFAAIGTPLVEPPRRLPARPSGSGQRVAVLVDVANVAGAARLLFDRSVDYHRLLAECSSGRTLVEARAYVIDKSMPGIEAFTTSLRQGGYKVQLKKPKTFADGSIKADWDLAIAVDALQLADRVDVIVLVSGDGDFVPLVQGLKRKNVATHAVAFAARAAAELKEAVDQFVELGEGVLQ